MEQTSGNTLNELKNRLQWSKRIYCLGIQLTQKLQDVQFQARVQCCRKLFKSVFVPLMILEQI